MNVVWHNDIAPDRDVRFYAPCLGVHAKRAMHWIVRERPEAMQCAERDEVHGLDVALKHLRQSRWFSFEWLGHGKCRRGRRPLHRRRPSGISWFFLLHYFREARRHELFTEESTAGLFEGATDKNRVPKSADDRSDGEQEAPCPIADERQSLEPLPQHGQSQHEHHGTGGKNHGANVAERALAARNRELVGIRLHVLGVRWLPPSLKLRRTSDTALPFSSLECADPAEAGPHSPVFTRSPARFGRRRCGPGACRTPHRGAGQLRLSRGS